MAYGVDFGVKPAPVYAGLVGRALACLVDIALPWGFVAAVAAGLQLLRLMHPQEALPFECFLTPALALVYYAAFEFALAATPGKMMLQLQVQAADGHRLGLAQAVLRNLYKPLSVLPLGLGLALPMVLERRQALHDVLAGCVVVRKPDISDYVPRS